MSEDVITRFGCYGCSAGFEMITEDRKPAEPVTGSAIDLDVTYTEERNGGLSVTNVGEMCSRVFMAPEVRARVPCPKAAELMTLFLKAQAADIIVERVPR